MKSRDRIDQLEHVAAGSVQVSQARRRPPTAWSSPAAPAAAETVYGVSQSTGTVVWTGSVENGDDSSPAVDAGNVFATYACNQDYDFDPITGALLWHFRTSCEGGGGDNPVLANGLLLSRDFDTSDVILSADAGTTEGAFSSGPAPAVDGDAAYMVSGGQMTAVKQSGLGTNAWTFAGNSMLDTSPIVVGNLVFEGSSSGNVYAVDAETGASTWSANTGSSIAGESGFGATISGLAAGEGTLIVPTSNSLVAYAGANVGRCCPEQHLGPDTVNHQGHRGRSARRRRRLVDRAAVQLQLPVVAMSGRRWRLFADHGRDERGVHADTRRHRLDARGGDQGDELEWHLGRRHHRHDRNGRRGARQRQPAIDHG